MQRRLPRVGAERGRDGDVDGRVNHLARPPAQRRLPDLDRVVRLELVRLARALWLAQPLVVEIGAEGRADVADAQHATLRRLDHRVVVRHLAVVQQRDAAFSRAADHAALFRHREWPRRVRSGGGEEHSAAVGGLGGGGVHGERSCRP